jgi:hypothetical protein
MNRHDDTFKRDAERLRKLREFEERAEPTHKTKGTKAGFCLLFAIAMVAAGAIAFYVLTHRDRFASLFKDKPKPEAVETAPDNGY